MCHHYKSFCICPACSPAALRSSLLHVSVVSSPSASSPSSSPESQEGVDAVEEDREGSEFLQEEDLSGERRGKETGDLLSDRTPGRHAEAAKQIGVDQTGYGRKVEGSERKREMSKKREIEVDDGSIPLMLLAQFSSPAETLRHVQPLKLRRTKFTAVFASTDGKDQTLLLTRKRRSSDYNHTRQHMASSRGDHRAEETRFLSTVGEDSEGDSGGGDSGCRSKESFRGGEDEGEQSYTDSTDTDDSMRGDEQTDTADDWGGAGEISSSEEDREENAFPLKPPQLFRNCRRKSQVSRQRFIPGNKDIHGFPCIYLPQKGRICRGRELLI